MCLEEAQGLRVVAFDQLVLNLVDRQQKCILDLPELNRKGAQLLWASLTHELRLAGEIQWLVVFFLLDLY